MSKFDSEHQGTQGYFMPEDSQFRLRKLHEYIVFLSRLAEPRTLEEEEESMPEVGMGELSICLELLAEQVEMVVEAASGSARWEKTGTARTRDDRAAPAQAAPGAEGAPAAPDAGASAALQAAAAEPGNFGFGITTDQRDALASLLQAISAHGDAVSATDTTAIASHSLPATGRAIADCAAAAQGLLAEIERQRLGDGRAPRAFLGEARAVYRAAHAPPAGGAARGVRVPLGSASSIDRLPPPARRH